MLLSIGWLQEFVAVEDIPVSDITERLTMSGFEVENVIEVGPQWDHIIVAEVQECRRHPDADKLTVNSVFTGERTLQVVCGAPNVRSGQKVALALPGAAFAGGLVIKRSKIRGQISEGMLCSAAELEIGEPDGGILILDDNLDTGALLADALGLRDRVLDISITPNRCDCNSVIGLAREVAALFERPLRLPECSIPDSTALCAGDKISVETLAPEACPRYCAGYAYDISIRPAPLWMRRRLENCGIRSINNIVDITNYVLLEWGQPLHAFDYRLLSGAQIFVRAAANEERFTTLDGVSHTLPMGALMICDAESPRALAGIMGGLDSSITDGTVEVLIESAYFNPASIASTGRALGLKTEASQRFEKGVDFNGVVPALGRALVLIDELKAGRVAGGIVDHCPAPPPASIPVSINVATVNTTLGLSLDAETIARCLTRLHMSVRSAGPDTLEVTAPSSRYDIHTPIDLIEEVARINGYDTIPVTCPTGRLVGPQADSELDVARLARSHMTSSGFTEVINYSFQSPEVLAALRFADTDPRSKPIRLRNPLSTSQSVMRTTVLGSLLQNLQHNLNSNRCPACAIFELSNIFLETPEQGICEKRMLAGLAYGSFNTETWARASRSADIFDLKGCIESLCSRLHIPAVCFEPGIEEPFLIPQTGMRLFVDNVYCGLCGTIQPDIADGFDAESPVHVFELDFRVLCAYYAEHRAYVNFSRFPAVQRDLALVIDREVTAADVSAAIAEFKNDLLKQWRVFDFYQGGSVDAGKKSIAYRLVFQSDERTLTDSEVNKIHDRLLEQLRARVGAELR